MARNLKNICWRFSLVIKIHGNDFPFENFPRKGSQLLWFPIHNWRNEQNKISLNWKYSNFIKDLRKWLEEIIKSTFFNINGKFKELFISLRNVMLIIGECGALKEFFKLMKLKIWSHKKIWRILKNWIIFLCKIFTPHFPANKIFSSFYFYPYFSFQPNSKKVNKWKRPKNNKNQQKCP